MSGAVRDLVAKNIRTFRIEKGLSQDKLAKKCRLSLRFISRAENDPQNLTLESLETIATALGVSVSDLVQSDSKAPKSSKKTLEALDQVIRLLHSYRSRL